MQTARSSATRRLCHPSGVRALLGPVSGGGATRHAPANGWVPSGNRAAAVWVPERNKEGSRAVARSASPGLPEKRAMHPGVPGGWNSNGASVSNAALLSPLRGEGPFWGPIRWCCHAPATLCRCIRHLLQVPGGNRPAGRWYALSASTKGGKTTRPGTLQTIPAGPCPTRTGSLPASGSDKWWKLKHGPPGAIDADLKTVTDRSRSPELIPWMTYKPATRSLHISEPPCCLPQSIRRRSISGCRVAVGCGSFPKDARVTGAALLKGEPQ